MLLGMKAWIVYASLLLLVSCCMAANPKSSEKLSFEVASIKPSEPMTMGQVRIGMNTDAGMLRYTNVSLKDCIRAAYRVKDFQIEGPGWMESSRFDIVAKLPEGSTQEQVPEMLQALLADRFKLTFHRDSKEHPIYALVVGKTGAKLKPADVQTAATPTSTGMPAARGGGLPRGGMMIQMDGAGAHLKAPAASLSNIADMISRFTERPVVDMTEIKGQYDFDLVFAPEVMRGMPRGMGMGAPPPGAGAENPPAEPAEKAGTIAEAVQAYGLKLEPRKAPMDVLVIDTIEKTPTDN
jgi:uncharacterized protein (TIGR03435 family)